MDEQKREAWRERNRIRDEYAKQIRAAADDEQALRLLGEYGSREYAWGWNEAMTKITELADEWKRSDPWERK